MSATAPLRRPAALRLPASAPSRTTATPKASGRPRLVLVSQRRTTAGRLPFIILIGGLLSLGLVSVLLLHMLAAQDAYRANTLQKQLASLTDQEQQVATAVEADSSPSALRARAAALGMRPATVTSFRQLKDGRAIGLQTPIPAAPSVTQTTATTTSATATKASTAGKTAGKSTVNPAKTVKTAKPATTNGTAATGKATRKATGTTTATKHHKPTTGP